MVWAFLIVLIAALIYWLFMSSYSQVFGRFPYKSNTTKKLVALTFDDGPNEPYTSELLDYFDKKKIKVTFFVVGKNVQRHPKTLIRAYQSGHTIGNHSLSHQFHKYFTSPGYAEEIGATQSIIFKCVGVRPALFRPPWLWRQPLLFRSLRSQKLHPISGEFGDYFEPFWSKSATIAKRTIHKVKPGSIIIYHDGFDARGGNRAQTVGAVKLVVEELSKQGYSFVTVDKLLSLKPYQ